MDQRHDLEIILKSRTPIVVIETRDEARILDILKSITIGSTGVLVMAASLRVSGAFSPQNPPPLSAADIMIGILGKKLGMTQIFQPDGTCVPVTG